MKTVTAAFKAAQADESAVAVRRISYKRRYWIEASKTYAWEAAWTTLGEDQIVAVSPITAKLDTDAVNEFKISNVTIQLKNADRRWSTYNPFGVFKKDTASPYYGYEPFWTKFKIETGYVVAGVDTYLPLFVGVAVEFQTDAYSDNVQISVQGLEALLQNANAENVSTLVTDETPSGTVNGTNKDFTTIQPGVGIVTLVTVDGFAKKAGSEYSLSQLDDTTLGAKITFATAPTGGQVVKVSYRYWKQNNKIESLVSDLLLEAGIGLGSQSIQTIIFPVGVQSNVNLTSQVDFLAGTHSKADLISSPGDIKVDRYASGNGKIIDNFSDGDYTASPAWTTALVVNDGSVGLSVVSGELRFNRTQPVDGAASAYVSSSDAVGAWQFKTRFSGDAPSGALSRTSMYFFFMASALNGGAMPARNFPSDGYMVLLSWSPSFGKTLSLIKMTGTTGTDLGSKSFSWNADTTYTIKVTRTSAGVITVYVDGVQHLQATDTTYNTATIAGFASDYDSTLGSYTCNHYFDDFTFTNRAVDATWESATIDLGSTPTAFDRATIVKALTGNATVTVYTKVSTDGISWDAYAQVGTDGTINSALKRYLMVKVVPAEDTVDNTTAVLNSITIPYSTTTTPVKLARFTGKTVYQAIQDLGAFANYEWGFTEAEVFFFRSKNAAQDVDETFDSGANLIDVAAINNGYDRVYHEVEAEFGAFKIVVGDDGSTHSGPLSRFGKRRFTVGNSDILISNDTDVATGIAIGLQAYLSRPRRTARLRTKLMEWVDLSDTVMVNYVDAPGDWWLGDTDVYLGQPDISLHGPEANTFYGVKAKVVGYRHDIENKISEFEVEEILQ